MSKSAFLSEEVLQLVDTIERLSADDQERILRIVSLLGLAPWSSHEEFRQVLRNFIDRKPESATDRLTGIEELIEFLECRVLGAGELAVRSGGFYCGRASRRPN